MFLLAASTDVFFGSTIDCAPIAHDIAIEAKDFSQVVVQRPVVGTGVLMIDFVVAAHGRTDLSIFDGKFERWIVHLHLSSFINIGALAISIDFLVVVDIVLHVG